MQLTDTVHALTLPFTVPTPGGPLPRSVNVYLLCAAGVTLIDSGVAGSEGAIFAYLERLGRGRRINRLLLTHSHPDHIGAARAIRAATGCTVLAAAAERSWIEETARQARERPVPGFDLLVGGAVTVDVPLDGGETLDLGGGLSLEVISTPGHSAGSLGFYLPGEEALFCGDAIPLPGDLPIYDDYPQSLETLAKLAAFGEVQLLEAWGVPGAIPAGKRLAEARSWLERVDAMLCRVREEDGAPDAMELCRRVVEGLGLPPLAVNPLVARSLRSHGARRFTSEPVR